MGGGRFDEVASRAIVELVDLPACAVSVLLLHRFLCKIVDAAIKN
jgi:hypothetical protein